MSVFIIAEAGVNHNGRLDLAFRLIEEAKKAGCDAVKFQSFKTEKLVTRFAKKAEYQVKNTNSDDSQYEMLKKLELSNDDHIKIIKYCNEVGICFMSTPFDETSADMLEDLGIEIYKIPSGEITNKPYIKHVASKQKPIILSTGMSTLDEVKEAVSWIREESDKSISILHCSTEYPADFKDINLRAIQTMSKELNLSVGYSDHTVGIEASIAAVSLGACIIEKHFTLDKSMEGPDHRASLDINELNELVRAIRNIELALGDGEKRPRGNELKNIDVVRKSIVAATKIEKGQVLTEEILTIKRPGSGIAPKYFDTIIGKTADRDYDIDDMIGEELL